MATIPHSKRNIVEKLYRSGFSMKEVAEHLGASLFQVEYFMRHQKIARRSMSEMNAVRFARKAPSYKSKVHKGKNYRELCSIVAMLYWGEGYKGTSRHSANILDFANSDPTMVSVFLKALRSLYFLDESRWRVLLYCYSDQDITRLIRYWARLTGISAKQFSKPYVRHDFKPDARKMEYGLIHLRYGDKKLLLELLNLIESFRKKYAPVV